MWDDSGGGKGAGDKGPSSRFSDDKTKISFRSPSLSLQPPHIAVSALPLQDRISLSPSQIRPSSAVISRILIPSFLRSGVTSDSPAVNRIKTLENSLMRLLSASSGDGVKPPVAQEWLCQLGEEDSREKRKEAAPLLSKD